MTEKTIVLFAVLLLGVLPIGHVVAAPVQVGVFVYTWYDPSVASNWEYPKIVDKPLLGFYDSSDSRIVVSQIMLIDAAGFDFVMLSWLGVGSFSDKAVGMWYRIAESKAAGLRLSIMVEPYNEGGSYNYQAIYNRAYGLYQQYPAISFMVDDKPVIFFYNGAALTGNVSLTLPLDTRFHVMTVGHRDYVNFWYDDVRNFKPASIPHRGQISVLPRFDDSRQYALGLRDHVNVVDPNLTEGLYDSQWRRALSLAADGLVRWITVVSWNEYPERSAIEPHYDGTAYSLNRYYLFSQTCFYIEQLHIFVI